MAAATVSARTPLGKDIVHTLTRLAEVPPDPQQEGSDPSFWVRAARAAWLIGDLDQAYECYRTIVPALLVHLTTEASRYGMFAEFAAQALGCAWMAYAFGPEGRDPRRVQADQQALRTVAAAVLSASARLASEVGDERTPRSHGLVRIHAEMTTLRAMWYGSWVDEDFARELQRLQQRGRPEQGMVPPDRNPFTDQLRRIQQRGQRLDPGSQAQWTASREATALPVYVALLQREQLDDTVVGRLLQVLDEKLREGSSIAEIRGGITGPPTIGDLVDEELVSLATAVERRGGKVTGLRLPVQPGTRRSEVL